MAKRFFAAFVAVVSAFVPFVALADDEGSPQIVESAKRCVGDVCDVDDLSGGVELLAFTRAGCAACDAVRADLAEAAREYPITVVDVSTVVGAERRVAWSVSVVPTFVLVRRNEDGSADEIERWAGSARFRARLVSAFDASGVEPVGIDGEYRFPPRPIPEPRPIPRPTPRPAPRPRPIPRPIPRPFPFLFASPYWF